MVAKRDGINNYPILGAHHGVSMAGVFFEAIRKLGCTTKAKSALWVRYGDYKTNIEDVCSSVKSIFSAYCLF